MYKVKKHKYKAMQLNLKIPVKLLEDIEKFVVKYSYSNAQEVIREAIRDKIFGPEIVRNEYFAILKANKGIDYEEIDKLEENIKVWGLENGKN